ncbi:MAG TPA: hypothetical protein VGB20_02650 [bacterium]
MTDDPRLASIQAVAEPILAQEAMELVELSCRPVGRQLAVRILVDAVGGVTISRCARVNQRLTAALEQANQLAEVATIEVSSPGLDRPLERPRDFERAIGEQVEIELEAEGRRSLVRGMVLAVQAEAVVLNTPGGNLTIRFSAMRGARKSLLW